MSFAAAFHNGTHRGAQVCLVLAFLAFPMSVALANVALLLTLLLWLLSLSGAASREALRTALRNPLVAPALALFAWVVIAIAWSPAERAGWAGFVQKYVKFAMVPIFIALLQDARVRRRCWQAFALAMLFTLAVTWLSVWIDIPWTKASRAGVEGDHTVFKDHIAQGLMLTVFSILSAVTFFIRGWRRGWPFGLAWLLAGGAVLFLSQGRTGYVAWAAATGTFFVVLALARSRRLAIGALAALALTLCAAFVASPVLKSRVTTAWQEATAASNSTALGDVTSAGARVEMTRFALHAALEAPVLGHGTASYPVQARQHFTTGEWCSVVCPHPHNQFLFFLVEQGVVGLVLFLGFLVAIAREGWRHEPRRRAFAWALVATAAAASMAHSAFWLSTESHCLVLMSALTMASLYARRTQGGPP